MSSRLLLHLLFAWYALLATAVNGNAQSTERVYLSGADKDHTVPWDFYCTSGARSGQWTTIPVPSQWELHGFGLLNYKKDTGTATAERGLYRRKFSVDKTWREKRVMLVFEGVMTDTSVKVNGESAGPTHQGGYYRFSYEITSLLDWGEENLLEVEVAKHSANPAVNKAERTADFWVFGGIYRPVYLQIVPQQFIERVAIDAGADGDFRAQVYVNHANHHANATQVEAQIQTLAGEPAGEALASAIDGGEQHRPLYLAGQLLAPSTWTAETPNLYQVVFRLKENDELLHEYRERFGFRTIEVRRGDGIYVNGHRVVLKGVNRHSTWPDSGRCLSADVHRLDIETIKAMNMNAVRMSHYPPDVEFLNLCDELGLYVLDELAGWHWHYDTPVGRKLVEAMVTRDVNHPSVVFWDNGNEGGNNVALDEVFGWFDPQQRVVLHPWEAYGDMNTAHYLEYDRAIAASRGAPTRHGTGKEYQEWEDLNDPNKYIYMPTEMLHGLYDGGGGAGLADYWSLMRESPVLGGGFMWNLFDEAVRRPDGSLDAAGNQAPDGIVGPYREREASFYTIKELWSPIQLEQVGDARLKVENRYDFTNAQACQLTWQLRRFPSLPASKSGFTVLAEGKRRLPDILPGKTGELTLDLSGTTDDADALAVVVHDPDGRELWTWVWEIGNHPPGQYCQTGTPHEVTIEEADRRLDVGAGDLHLQFAADTGMLMSVQRAGQAFALNNGPVATTGESTLKELTHSTAPNEGVIKAQYNGGLRSVTWRVRGDGWIDCVYEYQATGEHDFFGVTFDYPSDHVLAKRWLGQGPFRVWKNRRHGVTLNVWQNEFNDTATGYSGWVYPEFKGCFADVHWLQLTTTEGEITVVPHHRDGFVQVLNPSQAPEELRGKTSYSLPECGIGLLDAIPAVGSKFKPADSTGPQGQPTVGQGVYRGEVSFHFGEFD